MKNTKRILRFVVTTTSMLLLGVSPFVSPVAFAEHLEVTTLPAGFTDATSAFAGTPAARTAALQTLINTEDNLYIPFMGAGMDWIVTDTLDLTRDNQTIVFAKDVVVEAASGSFTGGFDSLFQAQFRDNVTLQGYGATFRMQQAEYVLLPPSEQRHGIALFSVKNFDVAGITIEDTGGDGIIVARAASFPDSFSLDVNLRDVTINNAFRNGISVISAENLLIDSVVIVDGVPGTAPDSGITIEPDTGTERISNVTIRNSIIQSSTTEGINIVPADGAQAVAITGLIENNTIISSGIEGVVFQQGAIPGLVLRDNIVRSNAVGFNVIGAGTQTMTTSAFSGNVMDIAGNASIPGVVTDVPNFVNDDDPTNPLYFFLDPSTSTNISLGDSDTSFIGARGVAGDFDGDAGIDGFDFLAWQRGESPHAGSANDLAAWEMFFGEVGTPLSGLAAGVGAVPEPSTSLLMLVGLALGCFRRSRR